MANEKIKDFDAQARVTMIATDKAPHHKAGEEFEVHPNLAKNVFERNGYAKYKDDRDSKNLANVNETVLANNAAEDAEKEKAGTMTTEGVKDTSGKK